MSASPVIVLLMMEGYIDLLYQDDDGLVVDYKTDSWRSDTDLDATVDRYQPGLRGTLNFRYARSMAATIPARDLRNHTAEVLRRVAAGEEIEVLKDNRPVARIVPSARRRRWLPAAEVISNLVRLGPDTTGLGEELRQTLTQTTDDLPW
jgi:prevent-host-death family protein